VILLFERSVWVGTPNVIIAGMLSGLVFMLDGMGEGKTDGIGARDCGKGLAEAVPRCLCALPSDKPHACWSFDFFRGLVLHDEVPLGPDGVHPLPRFGLRKGFLRWGHVCCGVSNSDSD
jgi:hypothetical protein